MALTYPRFSPAAASYRLTELRRLGVASLEFGGGSEVNGLRVLGKGCVGIVVIANTSFGRAALKIRRLDSDRSSLHHEAEMLRAANSVGVGPKLYSFSRNFIVMEYIEGRLLPDWLKNMKGKSVRTTLRRTLGTLVDQCFQLDQKGIDHGQLSRASKHIIVEALGKPCIIDFESASLQRRTINVTSVFQYLFIGGKPARTIIRLLTGIDKDALIEALRNYKSSRNSHALSEVSKAAKLCAWRPRD